MQEKSGNRRKPSPLPRGPDAKSSEPDLDVSKQRRTVPAWLGLMIAGAVVIGGAVLAVVAAFLSLGYFYVGPGGFGVPLEDSTPVYQWLAKEIQEGDDLYREGRYAEALETYEDSRRRLEELWKYEEISSADERRDLRVAVHNLIPLLEVRIRLASIGADVSAIRKESSLEVAE